MTEDPELFVECQSGGWIELQDSDGHPVASLHDEYLVLAHKMKAASKLYEACKAFMDAFGDDCPDDEPRDWYLAGAYDLARDALADATIPELPPYEAF